VFDAIRLHGTTASLAWGYRSVARLEAWAIVRTEGQWRLTATVSWADRFQCAQAVTRQELLFTAPRDKGQWCWELTGVELGTHSLQGTLGPPLH